MDMSHKGLRIAYKKSLIDYEYPQAVPETDTGRWVEYTKGREIPPSKELGKIAP